MKRIIEVERCSEECPYLKDKGQFCYIERRSITGINGYTLFPDWCPLPIKEDK